MAPLGVFLWLSLLFLFGFLAHLFFLCFSYWLLFYFLLIPCVYDIG